MPEIRVPANSRYKDTNGYVENGVARLGPLIPPSEIQGSQSAWLTHIVSSHEVGFPDVIAARYYGAGGEAYWWAICLANGIVDVDTDLRPGLRIRIPPRNSIMSFGSRGPV